MRYVPWISLVAGLSALGAMVGELGATSQALMLFWVSIGVCSLFLRGGIGVEAVVAYLAAFSVFYLLSSPDLQASPERTILPFTLAVLSVGCALVGFFGKGAGARRWALVVLALGLLVASFSGPAGGAGRMYLLLTRYLGLEPSLAEPIVFWFRKSLHVALYGAIAFAAYGLASGVRRAGQPGIFALAWALVHAIFDESRQASVAGRTASVWDVALDLVGASIGVWLAARVGRAGSGGVPSSQR